MKMEKGRTEQSAKLNVGQGMVEHAREFAQANAQTITLLINRARETYAQSLEQSIEPVTQQQVERELNRLFADRFTAMNLAALIELALSLEAEEDYEAFIVDEILGQAIAETIARGVPYRQFAQSAFHLMDALQKRELHQAVPRRQLATDDALAGIAAGLEALLPGWEWMKH